jgi:RNA polymerase sigma factor (sigma-70 family)
MAELEEIRLSELDEDHPDVVEAVYNFLLKVSWRFGSDESQAEDVAQTVLSKLLSMNDEQLGNVRNVAAYLASAAKHVALDRIRHRVHSPEMLSLDDGSAVSEYENLPSTQGMDREEENKILLSQIWNELKNDEDRQLLKMYTFGYSVDEIAEVLGIERVEVMRRRANLRYNLKKLLTEMEKERSRG